jgi:ribosomal protein S28E/S33
MDLLGPGCPVEDRERDWIQDNVAWLRGEFGDGPLSAPVVLPTSEWFPPPFAGTDDDVRGVVTRVAGYMGVRHQVRVEFSEEWDHAQFLSRLVPGPFQTGGAAGTYTRAGAEPVITLDRSVTREAAELVAVIAHELGHVRLLAEGRLTTAERRDHEPRRQRGLRLPADGGL